MDLVQGENSHVSFHVCGESSSSVCQKTQTDLPMDAVPVSKDNCVCSLGNESVDVGFSKFRSLKMDLGQGENSHVSLHECAKSSYVRQSNQQSIESQNVEEQKHEEVDSNAYGKPTSVTKCLCLAVPIKKSREQLCQEFQKSRKQLHQKHTTPIQVPIDPATSGEEVQAMCQTSSLDHHDLLMQKKSSLAPSDPVALPFESLVAEESITTAINPDVFWCNAEEEFEKLPEISKQLILYCSLFPADYAFEKDTFIGLLMAEDFIGNMRFESLEKAGDCFFSYLLGMKFILPSSKRRGEFGYKVNQALTPFFKKAYLSGDYLAVKDWKMDHIPERVQHISIVCQNSSVGNLELLERCSCLQTLLFSSYGSKIEELTGTLFVFLKSLRCLDLSGSNISRLPAGIGKVTTLRYINLSETRIMEFPESFCELCNLQTLILNDCSNLSSLPRGLRKLTSLRHLIFDRFKQFIGMPVGIGSLTNLRTLSAFIVGGYDDCSILELKHLDYLSGEFLILGLENITNPAEAQISLSSKKNIEKLELRWGEQRNQNGVEDEEILGHLQPHSLLKDFEVLNYGGLKFPEWVGDSSFVGLLSITLFNCKNCQFLPSLGGLPSLKSLCMLRMDSVMEINRQFCGTSQSSCAFPKLEVLKILGMSSLRKWTGVENGDFPYLKKLIIECCPELATFPSISYLKSLKYMEVSFCPKLSFLPSQGVSPSLEVLTICHCSILEEDWTKGEGENWPNISKDLSLFII